MGLGIGFTALRGFLQGARMCGAAEWDVLPSEVAERFSCQLEASQHWSWRRRSTQTCRMGDSSWQEAAWPPQGALALHITAASHAKGLVLFAVCHSKHSSRAEQKQRPEDTRSLRLSACQD